MVVFGHVELPEGTVCPLTNQPLRGEGRPKVPIRSGGGPEISCPHCQKRRHYPTDFQETNPEICKLILDESARIKREYKERQLEEQEEESESEEELIEETEDHIIIDKEINELIYASSIKNAEIAQKFQEDVEKSPRKSGKHSHGSIMRNAVWKKYFQGITQTMCTVCSRNPISFDNYSLGHIHPESRNGSNSENNLMPICSSCNSLMGTQHLYYYAWNVHKKILWFSNTF